MTQKVTIQDVARRAKVSVGSVSRALNDYPYVSAELKEKVHKAASELGYEADFLANSLRRGTTNSIGFLVGTISNPVIATIFEGASQFLVANGYSIILMSSQNQAELDHSHLRFLSSRQVDGIILSSAAETQDRVSDLISKLGIPTVMLDRMPPSGDHLCAVQSDHSKGMRVATHHLIQNGHHDIAFIGGPRNHFPTQQRYEGYQLALQDAGIALNPDLVRFTNFKETDAYAEVLMLMGRRIPPTALITAGNITLMGSLQALHERNIEVGKTFAIVGSDDIHIARLHRPPISVVARDLDLIGKTAARLLTENISGGDERIITLPTQFVIRESSNFRLG